MHNRSCYIPPGVSAQVAGERGYCRIESKHWLATYSHRLTAPQQQTPGLLIPIYRLGNPTAYTYVLRPDTPRISRNGKPIKYEWPAGIPLCLDVLPGYREALFDPTIPIWITEGAKKADALASACGSTIVPVNINGVWGWKRRDASGASHPLADLNAIVWSGRSVVLAFDNDVTRKPEVQQALKALASQLRQRGADVQVLVLPEVWPCKS